jgi:hypothetical protein
MVAIIMNNKLKVSILCSERALGEEAYLPISAMPTDNELSSLVEDTDHVYECKTIDDHFLDATKKLKKHMSENNSSHFYCYISDRVTTIQGKKYIFTLACTAFTDEEIAHGTSGLFFISDDDFVHLEIGKVVPEQLYETSSDIRVKEACNNARA